MNKEESFAKAYAQSGNKKKKPPKATNVAPSRKRNIEGRGDPSSLRRRGEGMDESHSMVQNPHALSGFRARGAFGWAIPDDVPPIETAVHGINGGITRAVTKAKGSGKKLEKKKGSAK